MPYRSSYGRRAQDFGATSFDSWGEYVSAAERPEVERLGRSSRDQDYAGGFMGTATFEDAVKLARDGWPDGAERLAELTARLEGKLGNVSAVKRIGYSMVGPGVLDLGRYMMGHPEPYMVWSESEELTDIQPDRIIKLLVCCGANANLADNQIWWRGAAAIAIADLIESSGARCEIELGRASVSHGGSRHIRRVLVKRAQDYVAPEILAFALAHPSSHRRIDWGVRETLPTELRLAMASTPAGGYAKSVDLDYDEREGALYVPYFDRAFSAGAEATAEWIIRALAAQGIEVETA
jgi:hypothetical protein